MNRKSLVFIFLTIGILLFNTLAANATITDTFFDESWNKPYQYREIYAAGTNFLYGDIMLMRDANALSSDLAKASVALASAAYTQSDVRNALINMGFSCDDHSSYSNVSKMTLANVNIAAFTVGTKRVGDDIIYCIPIKGTSSNAEWMSNFDLGDPDSDPYHLGFKKTAERILTSLEIDFNSDGYSKDHRIIWLTGHSRGAALANLIAGWLTDREQYAYSSQIFCYTFACPSVGKTSYVNGSYTNIWNFNSSNDVVPLLPLPDWGYGRYGRTIKADLQYANNFKVQLLESTGTSYNAKLNEAAWTSILKRFCTTAAGYESRHAFLDYLAYNYLGGRNNANEFEFEAYMIDHYGLSLDSILAAANYSHSIVFGGGGAILDYVVFKPLSVAIDVYNTLKDFSDSLTDMIINFIEDIFTSRSDEIAKLEKASGITIKTEEDMERAKEIIDKKKDAQEKTKDYFQYVSDLDSINDGSFSDLLWFLAVQEGHDWKSYIAWINSRYCGYNGWANSNITSLDQLAEIQECDLSNVTSFGKNAFKNCQGLIDINIPQSIEVVGHEAFSNCINASSLYIPDTACYLSDFAFRYCSGLNSVTMPVDLSRDGVFDCPNVQSILYTAGHSGIMPNRNTPVGNVYKSCIEYSARNSLSNVIFDEGVKSISDYAFYKYEASDTSSYNVLLSVTLADSITYIGYEAFYNNQQLTINNLPASLETLGSYAFYNTAIGNFTIPPKVTKIPNYCFAYCKNITSITIPATVTDLSQGNPPFAECTGVTEITMPIELAGYNIFGCPNVGTLHYTVADTGVMPERSSSSADVNYYKNFIEYNAENALRTVIFDDGIKNISDYAFYKYDSSSDSCTILTSVTLPDSITSIGYEAFYNNTKLSFEKLPDSLETLGSRAFYNTGIGNFTIPPKVTKIPNYCFAYCKNITSITIPATVTDLSQGNPPFAECTGVTEITMPIELAGYNIFGCPNVETLHYTVADTGIMPERGSTSNTNSYQNFIEYIARNSLKTVIFDNGVKNISDYTFYKWNSSSTDSYSVLTSVTLPDSITSIGYEAFYNNTKLSFEKLPDSLETLGSYAFYNTAIGNFTIPPKVTKIPNYCFAHCKNITSITIPATVTDLSQGNPPFAECTGVTEITMPIELAGYNIFGCPNVETIHYTVADTGIMPERGSKSNINGYQYFIEYIARNSLKTVIFDDGVKNISDYTFYKWDSSSTDSYSVLTSVRLPDSITSIGFEAFYNNTKLSINGLPRSLTSLASYSFYNTGISFTQLPDGLTTIPSNCFYNCKNLTQLVVPSSIEEIQDCAFYATGLKKIIFHGGKPTLASNAFSGVPQAEAYYSSNLEGWAEGSLPTFTNCVTWIAEGQTVYTQFVLPAMLNTVEEEAFCGIAAQEIILPEGIMTVKSRAFADCPELLRISLPASLRNIASDAFDPGLLLLVPAGSQAETYAIEHDMLYIIQN